MRLRKVIMSSMSGITRFEVRQSGNTWPNWVRLPTWAELQDARRRRAARETAGRMTALGLACRSGLALRGITRKHCLAHLGRLAQVCREVNRLVHLHFAAEVASVLRACTRRVNARSLQDEVFAIVPQYRP